MEFGPGRNLATAIDEAVAGGADALAVAGGDGSLATAAAAALAYELPFVCVPAGTRNHFARDLGLIRPIQIAGFDALSDGIEGRIDVGEVSGHLFPQQRLARHLRRGGSRRGVSRCEGAPGRDRARRPRPRHRDLRTGHRRRPRRQPYRSCDRARVEQSLRPGRTVLARRPPDAERRSARDRRHRPTGDWTQAPGRAWSSVSLRVDASSSVHAGIDGEAVKLSAPLEFAIRPAALRVRTPRRVRSAGDSARARRRPTAPRRHR